MLSPAARVPTGLGTGYHGLWDPISIWECEGAADGGTKGRLAGGGGSCYVRKLAPEPWWIGRVGNGGAVQSFGGLSLDELGSGWQPPLTMNY